MIEKGIATASMITTIPCSTAASHPIELGSLGVDRRGWFDADSQGGDSQHRPGEPDEPNVQVGDMLVLRGANKNADRHPNHNTGVSNADADQRHPPDPGEHDSPQLSPYSTVSGEVLVPSQPVM